MADWTLLPQELVHLISKHLETPTDLMRFRSVCSSWRVSATPKRSRLPGGYRNLADNAISDSAFGFYLSKRTIFLITPPESQTETNPIAWLVKVEEDIPDRKRLLNPLTRNYIDSLPEGFPRILDVSRFRLQELGQEFVLHYVNCRFRDLGSVYMEKVVVMSLDDDNGNDFMLLTIHVSGKLAVFKSENRAWTIIHDMPSPFDDVILFKGHFYAVDNNGRTVIVDSSSIDLNVTANPVFGGDKKLLVESCGELLLVDMYLSIETEGGGFLEEYFEHLAYYMKERTVRFKVFRLNVEGKMWVELESLDNRVLFIGDDCAFSASACDMLSEFKGNCVFFADTYGNGEENEAAGVQGIGLFEFDSGNIGSLTNYPEYNKLFWPPPRWIFEAGRG